ncbi:MAG TPA: YqgE/AlgH family protein [Burkholderiales bacterium]|nr:YqgE/AlgH family protein [Burkholderiales bacterium]
MNRSAHTLLAFLAAFLLHPLAAAADLGGAVVLVAKRNLQDRIYGATILVAKPLGEDRHVGFILNKPTQLTLDKLFPDHAPSKKVRDPVYLGGPFGREVIFALVRRAESPGARSLQIAPNLFLAFDTPTVDRIIENEAKQARFFSGMVMWKPGELSDELKRGLWHRLEVRIDRLLGRSTEGLWEELVGRSERRANTI